jgi:RHS repeat-associated protein
VVVGRGSRKSPPTPPASSFTTATVWSRPRTRRAEKWPGTHRARTSTSRWPWSAAAPWITTKRTGWAQSLRLPPSNGTIAQSYTYDSFGNTTNSSGSLTNFFRYTAREFDTETNLYYYRARYYDPASGRFISEDPLLFSGSDDFYVYAQNSPIMHRDPTGQTIKLCSKGGFQNPSSPAGIGNHAFFYDTRNGTSCGRGNGNHPNGPDNPSTPGTFCVEVPGSAGVEDTVMQCCAKRAASWKGAWWNFLPWVNDCQTLTEDCLASAGLKNPGVPGGRVGCRGNCKGPLNLQQPIVQPK